MGVLLGMIAAVCYGTSDFIAGVGGRRGQPSAVTLIAQPFGLLAAVIALLALSAHSPSTAALWWGALSGVGSGAGTIALYRGLATAQMSIVAPLSAVLAAALPALAGLLLGERLSIVAWVGIGVALPAVLLVSLHPGTGHGSRRAGIGYGLCAGVGFAVLFIALARAGTHAGAWPLIPGQVVAVVIVIGVGMGSALRPGPADWATSWRHGVVAGVLAGLANLVYLAATGQGQLAIVAVLTALYPVITVLLARIFERERWGRLQAAGLVIAALAVALISIG